RRSLEHHVLEKMRQAALAIELVARADAVPHLECHRGALVVLEQEDLEAVVENRFFHGIILRRGRRGRSRQEKENESDDANFFHEYRNSRKAQEPERVLTASGPGNRMTFLEESCVL